MITNYKDIGKKIRHYRLMHHLTQEDLAFEIETTAAYISNLELGKKIPSLKKLLEISEVLNITANDLLYDSYDKSNPAEKSLSGTILSYPPGEQEQILSTLNTLIESITLNNR